jgi:uncharacterized protein involved in exopolysaccharide biosynthesis
MALRMSELLFRYRLLLLAPIVLGLAFGVISLLTSKSTVYSTHASIWIERPTDLSGGEFTEFNPYLSPAQNQANAMGELMTLNSFASRVAQRISINGSAGEIHPSQLRSSVFFTAAGDHVLYVSALSESPLLAQATVKAVVDEYSALYQSQIKDRAERAKSFYQEQLAIAKVSMETTSAEVRAYLARNPQLASVDLANPPSSALRDTELARLLSAEITAQNFHKDLLDKYAESQISLSAANGASANYTLMDEPGLPQQPLERGKRAMLMPLILGLGLGLSVSGAIAFILWRLDRTLRLPQDIVLPGLDVPVMALPLLKSDPRWPVHFVRMASALSSGIRRPAVSPVKDG